MNLRRGPTRLEFLPRLFCQGDAHLVVGSLCFCQPWPTYSWFSSSLAACLFTATSWSASELWRAGITLPEGNVTWMPGWIAIGSIAHSLVALGPIWSQVMRSPCGVAWGILGIFIFAWPVRTAHQELVTAIRQHKDAVYSASSLDG